MIHGLRQDASVLLRPHSRAAMDLLLAKGCKGVAQEVFITQIRLGTRCQMIIFEDCESTNDWRWRAYLLFGDDRARVVKAGEEDFWLRKWHLEPFVRSGEVTLQAMKLAL